MCAAYVSAAYVSAAYVENKYLSSMSELFVLYVRRRPSMSDQPV